MERRVQHAVRFVTAFRRANEREDDWDHFLVLEWADNGNIRELWERESQPKLTASLVKEVITQLLGLAEALKAIHYPSNPVENSNILHGDLKPENILSFKTDGLLGTLKLGDWGLARERNWATKLHVAKSSLPGGTVRYEPPESGTGIIINGQPVFCRSRLHDTWAMGCIVFEFLVWLLGGSQKLNEFHSRLLHKRQNDAAFWESVGSNSSNMLSTIDGADISPLVREEMTAMARNLRQGEQGVSPALVDLLELVRERLLIVPLPLHFADLDLQKEDDKARPNPNDSPPVASESEPARAESLPSTAPAIIVIDEERGAENMDVYNTDKVDSNQVTRSRARARATDLCEALEKIKGRGNVDESYWFTGNSLEFHLESARDDSGDGPQQASITTGFSTQMSLLAPGGHRNVSMQSR